MTQNPYQSPENVPAEGHGPQTGQQPVPPPAPSSAPAWETSAASASTEDAWGPAAQQWAQSPASSAPAPSGYSAPSAPHAPAAPAYPGSHAGAMPGTAAGSAAPGAKGFFGSLFDFSFRHFMTIRFVQIFFIIGIVLSILYYIVGFIFAILLGATTGYYGDFNAWPVVLYVLFGWIAPVLAVLGLRVGLEFVVATIRTAQNTTEVVDHLKARG